jgi:2-keto-4-pentenoate hydratase
VALGASVPPPVGGDLAGYRVRARQGQVRVCEVDARAATGHAPQVLLHAARLLAEFGERLRASDLVILGAMNPPTLAEPGATFAVDADDLGEVTLHFAASKPC